MWTKDRSFYEDSRLFFPLNKLVCVPGSFVCSREAHGKIHNIKSLDGGRRRRRDEGRRRVLLRSRMLHDS